MVWNDDAGRSNLRARQLLSLVVIMVTLLTALLSVSLHYYFSRQLAVESAEDKYRLTATATRDYLANIDGKASETVRVLTRFPSLITSSDPQRDVWVHKDTLALFAEVMRATPLFYALYIGFDNGDLFELVNLNCSDAVRRQLNATPSDRWVVIRVEGEGEQRQRHFDFYSDAFELNFSRSEVSDYDVRERLWYTSAGTSEAVKTPAYLFQHLQAPGQSFVMKLPGSEHVLGLDITFSTMTAHLRAQALSAEGELFLFQENGELLASNVRDEQARKLPFSPRIALTAEQRSFLTRMGSIRASNETDWAPIDFAVAGEPHGYSVDILRLVSSMTGMPLAFVNGYTWGQLAEQFDRGEIEILQPVGPSNASGGSLTLPIVDLPFALVTRSEDDIDSFEQLNGKRLVMISGWSVIPQVRAMFPHIEVLEVADARTALLKVSRGEADATLDTALILGQGIRQYYLTGLKMDTSLAPLADLPTTLHLKVRPGAEPLAQIIDQALVKIPAEAINELRNKWFSANTKSGVGRMSVVPYKHLQELPQQPLQQNLVSQVTLNGEAYFSFASVFTRDQTPPEYFALMIPAKKVYERALHELSVSAMVITIVWLLLMPLVLIFLVMRPVKKLMQKHSGSSSR